MKKFFAFALSLCTQGLYAQDVIVKNDGTTILSKVLEVNISDVKYKKASNMNGPTYTISKSEVMSINYENGDKDVFDRTMRKNAESSLQDNIKDNEPAHNPSSHRMEDIVPDARNKELLSLYNTVYEPTRKVSRNTLPSKEGIVIIGVKSKSVMSNEDIEMRIERKIFEPLLEDEYQGYNICFTNKSDKVVYVDKGNCFRIDAEGDVLCYYDPTVQTTVSNGGNSGASLGLGSIAGVLGIGGIVGQLASGISVGGGSSHSVTTTYTQQRILSIPPHGTERLETSIWIPKNSSSCGLARGIVNNGCTKTFGEEELPWKQEYYITYSTDEFFGTYSTLKVEMYIHEIIGGAGEMGKSEKNEKYIQGVNEYTLNEYVSLEKVKHQRIQKGATTSHYHPQ